jgi:hypothetical protein
MAGVELVEWYQTHGFQVFDAIPENKRAAHSRSSDAKI